MQMQMWAGTRCPLSSVLAIHDPPPIARPSLQRGCGCGGVTQQGLHERTPASTMSGGSWCVVGSSHDRRLRPGVKERMRPLSSFGVGEFWTAESKVMVPRASQ